MGFFNHAFKLLLETASEYAKKDKRIVIYIIIFVIKKLFEVYN